MLKTNSVLFSKNLSSPSPDRKAATRIKSTSSPCKQIQKYLTENPKYKKSKITIKSNMPNSPKANIGQIFHNPADLQKIKSLQNQIVQYRKYVEEYELLASRNKKMEEQMYAILQELERRNTTTQNYQTPKVNRMKTFETSEELEVHEQREMQLQDLYDYISEMESTMHNLAIQNKEMETELKKNVSRDMNDLEKRLMSYIFGLEEKLSEATMKNHQIMKNIETFRPYSFQPTSRRNTIGNIQQSEKYQRSGTHKDSAQDSNAWPNTDSNRNNYNMSNRMIAQKNSNQLSEKSSSKINIMDLQNSLTESLKKSDRNSSFNSETKINLEKQPSNLHNNSDKKQIQSLVSMRNIEVSSSVRTPTLQYSKTFFQSSNRKEQSQQYQYLKNSRNEKINVQGFEEVQSEYDETTKKQRSHSMSLKMDSKLCQNCLKYIKEMEKLRNDNEKLRTEKKSLLQDILKLQQNLSSLKRNNKQRKEEEKDSSGVSLNSKKIVKSKSSQLNEKFSMLQSHINIIVDTSLDQSVNVVRDAIKEQTNSFKSSDLKAENCLLLEKIKNQLINVMQSIQELVHICGVEPNADGLLAELKRKDKMQEMLIGELEEELARLRMELKQTKNKNEKLEKLWKTQIKEEEDQHYSPRNQNNSVPVPIQNTSFLSCVDPTVTKSKIDHILKSIKSFEDQYKNSEYP